MKTVLLLNSNMYAVRMFQGFVKEHAHEISHVYIFPYKSKNKSVWEYLKFFLILYGFVGSIKKGFQIVGNKFKKPAYKNLEDLCSSHNVPCSIFDSPSNKSFQAELEQQNPDVVFAALPQIVPQKVLEIPKYGVLNKHSSLLPSYGGVYPVFWQMLNQEKEIGITVHQMSKEIDKGKILYQKSWSMPQKASFDSIYHFLIDETSEVINQSFEKLKNNSDPWITPSKEASYFSFPKKEDIKKFRKVKGIKII